MSKAKAQVLWEVVCGGDMLRWKEVAIGGRKIASGTVLLKIKLTHVHECS